MNNLFHYTIREHLEKILSDGFIRQATIGVPGNVKPVVWCSLDPVWEQTANKQLRNGDSGQLISLDMKGTHNYSRGLVRIEVQSAAAPHDWDEYKRQSGDTRRMLKALYDLANQSGASPRSWRCSFQPILRVDWVRIEYWNGSGWQPQPWEKVQINNPQQSEV
jgi:hypothetical protein